jgi:hypothetical protein
LWVHRWFKFWFRDTQEGLGLIWGYTSTIRLGTNRWSRGTLGRWLMTWWSWAHTLLRTWYLMQHLLLKIILHQSRAIFSSWCMCSWRKMEGNLIAFGWLISATILYCKCFVCWYWPTQSPIEEEKENGTHAIWSQ